MFLTRGTCGPKNYHCKGRYPKVLGEAIPRDTGFPPLTVNSHRNESLTHMCSLKRQERRRQEKGLTRKKRKGEADKDEEREV